MPVTKVRSFDRTRRFYEADPESYATATARRTLAPVLAAFADRLEPGSRVVDLGCGAGHDLKAFANRGLDAVGLDYSEPMARLARRLTSAAVVIADIRQLPFPDESFGGLWASASLLHLGGDDLVAGLAECRRVSAPGAAFFSSVKYGGGEFLDGGGRLFVLHDEQTWRQSLAAAGFAVARLDFDDGQTSPRSADGTPWLTSLAFPK